MAGGPEDQRSAASIYASLSSYVMTASLGVIAAQAALATFVLDKRGHLTWFYIWMVAGIFASVTSIVFGGKGIAAIASEGFDGTWSLKPNGDSFNWQALFCLVGMLFLLLSLFCGRPKPENPYAEEMRRLSTTVTQQQRQIDDLNGKYAAVAEKLKSLAGDALHKSKPAAMKKHR